MADVIIDPTSGRIYWNDDSNESISISGTTNDTISFLGFNNKFSPGSSLGSGIQLVNIKDEASDTLTPGSDGLDLGSTSFRWELYATSGNFNSSIITSDTTESSSRTTGSIRTSGGASILKNITLGGSLVFDYNTSDKITLKSPASPIGTITYTLPVSPPTGTGTSVLYSNSTGDMSWIPLQTISKSVTILSPTNTDKVTLFYIERPITISSVQTVVRGTGSASVTWQIYHGNRDSNATQLFTSSQTTSNVSVGNTSNSGFSDNTVDANKFVWVELSSVATGTSEFHMTVFYPHG